VRSGAEGELEPVAVDESMTTLLFTSGARSHVAPSSAPPAPAPAVDEWPASEVVTAPVDPGRAADRAAERTAALVGW
jgi:hypothetical protein